MIVKRRRSGINSNIASLYVQEIFDSIQGEGLLSGFLTRFVRTNGCTVGCAWCDTKNSWRQNKKFKMLCADVYKRIVEGWNKNAWICITGGEPLEQAESVHWLIGKLHKNGYDYISVETSGYPFPDRKVLFDMLNDNVFFSVSPKLSSATKGLAKIDASLARAKEVVEFWLSPDMTFNVQLKFVVGTDADLRDLRNIFATCKGFKLNTLIFIQPDYYVFQKDKTLIKKLLLFLEDFPNVRLSTQMHKTLDLK
jgi:7-carboxy-7-deazaguanine synthase